MIELNVFEVQCQEFNVNLAWSGTETIRNIIEY